MADPNRFDKNYPRKHPQELPRRTRWLLWGVGIVMLAVSTWVGWEVPAGNVNAGLGALAIIIDMITAALAGLALYPPRSLDIKDFATNCAWLSRVLFLVSLAVSAFSLVGVWTS